MSTPRGSSNTQEIQEKILKFGHSFSYETQRDAFGNIVIRKPAQNGKENDPSICIQAHLDMVCVKDEDSQINLEKDPLKPKIADDSVCGPLLQAQGTTLGADNGVGVCALLALLCDKELSHGPIECLFTIDEELGMLGALHIGTDMVKSKYLINLDNMEDGTVTIACASGIKVSYCISLPIVPVENTCAFQPFILSVKRCKSGHSGFEIHTGRANPISLIGRILRSGEKSVEREMKRPSSLRIVTVSGGSVRNVLATDSFASIVLNADEVDSFTKGVEEEIREIMEEYSRVEPTMKIVFEKVHFKSLGGSCEEENEEYHLLSTSSSFSSSSSSSSSSNNQTENKTDSKMSLASSSDSNLELNSSNQPDSVPKFALTEEASHRLVSLILTAPHGVMRMSPMFPGTTSISTNFFKIETQMSHSAGIEADIAFSFFSRALLKSETEYVDEVVESFAELGGLREVAGSKETYGSWLTSTDTELWKVTEHSFRKVFKKDPKITAVHAGYECGVFMERFPWLQCISIGPTITSPHTTHESLHLDTMQRYWDFLKTILRSF
eukprot:MONOS_11924.1-p1 / transcript=MONOS_11924.1 / gene=MONOS_11924 / organism=Monocercomonoides_exilis_PA203 / gene_product=aminoacyl-histidine dipeptidase / transcript_product=aminoacyl-histidine dipeptidase / location=Mono_scaffold00626:3576-5753(+) / protein_length=553 / sequence_SO=supercontig / SO=protein_coding / is_pseudo=false